MFSIGSEDWITVKDIPDIIVKSFELEDIEYVYKPATKDGRGLPGDVKRMLLDITKIKTLTGWHPMLNSKKSVKNSTRLNKYDTMIKMYNLKNEEWYLTHNSNI